MQEQNQQKKKENLATGGSAMAGGVVGVAAASAIPTSAQAQEKPDDEVDVVEEQPQTDSAHHQASQPHEPAVKQPQPNEPVPPQPTTPGGQQGNEGATLEVMAYETVTNEDGTLSDVAVVTDGVDTVVVVDVDRDGDADILLSDFNGNGQVDEGEYCYVQYGEVPMEPLRDACMDNSMDMAYNQGPDYTNDADVTDFMA